MMSLLIIIFARLHKVVGGEKSLLIPGDSVVPGKQSAIVVSKFETTVPLNVTVDRAAAVGSVANVVVKDGKELDQVASVVDGTGQTTVQQADPAKSLDVKTVKSTAAVEKPASATDVHDEGEGVDASGVTVALNKNGDRVAAVEKPTGAQLSPSEKDVSSRKNQLTIGKNISCSNSFDALAVGNEHGELQTPVTTAPTLDISNLDFGTSVQQVDRDAASESRRLENTYIAKQQLVSEHTCGQLVVSKEIVLVGRNLNATTPDFIPQNRQQQIGTGTIGTSSVAKAADQKFGQQHQRACTQCDALLHPNAGQQQNFPISFMAEQQQQITGSLVQQQHHNASTSGVISNMALISDHDRALLDALDSPKPHRCAYSTSSKTTSQKMKVSVAKRHEPCSAKRMKRHEPL
ncbi:hypothetical protein A4A49_04392 [Nicotiana attenuata]|uniref:Uncharacterized protein n=1 Tax=Nicotiana attenuata TaxID=49451 RepID=A0A1J6I043_NICAT|nr:hypothetical protein A4A49_04392 [Nicotiana attenuata]